MTLKVVDRFTTRDGRWDIDNRPFGISKEAIEKYGIDRNELGGASHIYVKVKPGDSVRFFTTDPTTPQTPPAVIANARGWANFAMWKSSAYWPPNVGPWFVEINCIRVAEWLGLPEGLHVSTFLIVEDVDEGSHPIPNPVKPVSHIQVIVDDVMVVDNWSAQ